MLILLAVGAVLATIRARKEKALPQGIGIVLLTYFVAFSLFVFSTGPILHLGSTSFNPHWPTLVLNLMGLFRGVGRFSWPMIYFLLGVSAVSLDLLFREIAGRWPQKALAHVICCFAVLFQFYEFLPEVCRFRDYNAQQIAGAFVPDQVLDGAIRNASEIVFVPAYDDPATAPWRPLSYYAIKYRVPIYTYHWLGRLNTSEAARIQRLTVDNVTNCKLSPDKVYVLKTSYMPALAQCRYSTDDLGTFANWRVVTIH